MSLHVFANIATYHGTAANNRAENEGNITTLQKLLGTDRRVDLPKPDPLRFEAAVRCTG
ncbi:MAG: hypothetical protein O3A00_27165 [Planctomycetota bacterium]|nr:hypothetical protein [Planctomycetota bacterium]